MNISNLLYQSTKYRFIASIISQGTFATQSDLIKVLDEFDSLMKDIKDKDEKDMVNLIIEDSVKELLTVLSSDLIIPGFTFGVKVNDINTKIYGGFRNNNGDRIENDTMFDIASITKMFTQIITYNLVNDGILNFDDEINTLDPNFKYLNGITIKDITTFSTEFRTLDRIDSKRSIEEARECLYKTRVINKGDYFYTDIGCMILKEVMETVTGLSYENLLDKYITSKLGLDRTKINIPEIFKNKLTGSPNIEHLRVNDSSANALGGFSGHAGIWSSSDDLLSFGQSMFNGIVPDTLLRDFYFTSKYDIRRGIVGNTFVPTTALFYCVPDLSSRKALSVIGSTRTQLNTEQWRNYINSSTILFNTAILDEQVVNEQRARVGKPPIKITKTIINNDGEYKSNDIRELIPIDKSTAPIARINAKTTLKLMFLDTLLNEYQKGTHLDLKVETDISQRLK